MTCSQTRTQRQMGRVSNDAEVEGSWKGDGVHFSRIFPGRDLRERGQLEVRVQTT